MSRIDLSLWCICRIPHSEGDLHGEIQISTNSSGFLNFHLIKMTHVAGMLKTKDSFPTKSFTNAKDIDLIGNCFWFLGMHGKSDADSARQTLRGEMRRRRRTTDTQMTVLRSYLQIIIIKQNWLIVKLRLGLNVLRIQPAHQKQPRVSYSGCTTAHMNARFQSFTSRPYLLSLPPFLLVINYPLGF